MMFRRRSKSFNGKGPGTVASLSRADSSRYAFSTGFSDAEARLGGTVQTPVHHFNFEKSDIVRVMLQSMRDMGFHRSAEALEEESGFTETGAGVHELRGLLVEGKWTDALSLMDTLLERPNNSQGQGPADRNPSSSSNESPAAAALGQLLVHRESYLESLEDGRLTDGLTYLKKLALLTKPDTMEPSASSRLDIEEYEYLSSLLLISGRAQLTAAIGGRSSSREVNRKTLADAVQQTLPMSLVLPPQRLVQLLEYSIVEQTRHCCFNGILRPPVSGLRTGRCTSEEREAVPLVADLNTYDHHTGKRLPSETIQIIDDFSELDGTQVWHVKFSNGGLLLACLAGDTVALYGVDYSTVNLSNTDKASLPSRGPLYLAGKLRGKQDKMICLSWSPSDRLLVAGDKGGSIFLWDTSFAKASMEMGSKVTSDEGASPPKLVSRAHLGLVSAVAWKDDQHFFSASVDCSIHLYDTSLNLKAHWSGSPVYDLVFSPNLGLAFAACNGPRYLRAFRADTLDASSRSGETDLKSEIRESSFPKGQFDTCNIVSSLACTRRGARMITQTGNDKDTLLEWDLRTGQACALYKGATFGGAVMHASLGGFHESFVATGTYDSRIVLWDRSASVQDGESGSLVMKSPLCTLEGHKQPVNAVSWSPIDTSLFVSASDDGTLRVWN